MNRARWENKEHVITVITKRDDVSKTDATTSKIKRQKKTVKKQVVHSKSLSCFFAVLCSISFVFCALSTSASVMNSSYLEIVMIRYCKITK